MTDNGIVKNGNMVNVNPNYENVTFVEIPKVKPFEICSNSYSEVIKALIKAKRNFKFIGKTAENPHYRSKHATLDVVYSSIQPSLLEHGLFITCNVVDKDDDPVYLKTKIKNEDVDVLHFVRRFQVTLIHESGEFIGSEVPFYVNPNDPQKTGISFTYLQRYVVAALLSLVIEDDDDGNAASGINPYVMPISKTQADHFRKFIKTENNPKGVIQPDDMRLLLTKYDSQTLADLPKDKFEEFSKDFDQLRTQSVLPEPVEDGSLKTKQLEVEKVVEPEPKLITKKQADELTEKRKTENWDVTLVKEILAKHGVNGGYKLIPVDKYDVIVTELEQLKNTKQEVED